MTNELKFNLEDARRAVSPVTALSATYRSPGVVSQLRLGGGSSALIDVRANDADEPFGLWLTAAHVLLASTNWGLVEFFDGGGRAPRHGIALVIARDVKRDVAAFFANFPTKGDVAKPFRISTRRVEPGSLLCGLGWGDSKFGDVFTGIPGRAYARPASREIREARLGKTVNETELPFDLDAPHWGWADVPVRPGDSGGPVLDAQTGELVGIRSGGFGPPPSDRSPSAYRIGALHSLKSCYYSTFESEFVAAARSIFASKIATKPYRFD